MSTLSAAGLAPCISLDIYRSFLTSSQPTTALPLWIWGRSLIFLRVFWRPPLHPRKSQSLSSTAGPYVTWSHLFLTLLSTSSLPSHLLSFNPIDQLLCIERGRPIFFSLGHLSLPFWYSSACPGLLPSFSWSLCSNFTYFDQPVDLAAAYLS